MSPETKIMEAPICPHCEQKMLKMTTPPMSNFDSLFMYVCFNDECSYYLKGWEWMEKKYSSGTSYRYKVDPFTGEKGPIPVWSSEALREFIDKKE